MNFPGDEPLSVPNQDGTPGRGILTVSSLNRLARSLLEGNFPAVVVEGEISNFVAPASGHWYLTLKDDNAQIRCAMFRTSNRRLRFRPENGMQVLVRGRLSLFEPRGDYQLIADDMEEAGDGALRRAYERLKAKLEAEGLFDESRKRPVGTSFRHIGVITSGTGAAIRDILTVFRRRFPAIRITLLPVAVQGRESPGEIVAAIATANRLAPQLGLEALIVGRGGGSLEDLQAFNEESVARAIAASKLPVVSAVGHEIDFTIADFVADLRAPTPSAAAELLSPDLRDTLQTVQAFRAQLTGSVMQRLRESGKSLAWLARQLKHPGRRLQEHAQALDLLEARLQRAFRWQLQRRSAKLAELQRALVVSSPRHRIEQLESRRLNLQNRLPSGIRRRIERARQGLNQSVRGLHAVSPLNTLGRGYSITYDNESRVLRSAEATRPGATLVTRLGKGTIESKVTRIGASEGNESH